MITIDTVSRSKPTPPFGCVLGRDTLRHSDFSTFLCLVVLASTSKLNSYLYKIKKRNKNFNRTAISRHLPKQVAVVACPKYSASDVFLRVRRIDIEVKIKKYIYVYIIINMRYIKKLSLLKRKATDSSFALVKVSQ